jgi:uncharacterized membrane protein
MPQTTLAGHPLHPQLIGFPVGLLPFSCLMDLLHLATGKKAYADTAYNTMVGGFVGGLAAGAAGAADYLTIPPNSESRKVGRMHAALNVGVLGLYSLNLLLRSRRKSPGLLPVALSILGTAGLVVAQWYGGELVYKLGMRVKPAMEGEQAPEWKLPGDEKIENAFIQAERRFASAQS